MFSRTIEDLVPELLNTEELEGLIQSMFKSNDIIKAENDLLEKYLTNTDPSLVENMDSILDAATAAIHKAERTVQLGFMASVTSKPHDSTPTTPRSVQTAGGSSAKVAAFTLSDKGPKIQASQKMEIIQRELDLLKAAVDEEKSSIEKAMFIHRCKITASRLRLREVEALRKNFEDNVSNVWVDKRTKTVAGESIIAYFEHRIKCDTIKIKEFQTRRKNICMQLNSCNQKLKYLGDDIKYVDYEKLLIEYKEAQGLLNADLEKLSKLKEANTAYQLALNNYNRILRKGLQAVEKKDQKLKYIQEKTKSLLLDECLTMNSSCNMKSKIRRYSLLITQHPSPDIIEYIQNKKEVNDMKNSLRVAARKKSVAKIRSTKMSSTAPQSVKEDKNMSNKDYYFLSGPVGAS